MKIFAISNNFSVLPHNNYKKEAQKTNISDFKNVGFSSQAILANYAKSNIINFGQSVDIDYDNFKLPKGAMPDEYQISAAKSLEAGNSVLVSAPTGTGKTAIAQYIISKNLKDGKRTFYTTPLKALSNQKLLDFRKIYGDENVGILTGDRRENADAPIIVMTTEVYRNMAFDKYFSDKPEQKIDAKTIIFDEFHYLGDESRGASWEESIIFSPPNTQILGLSATIGNDDQLAQWLGTLHNGKLDLVHVPTQNRHVPLAFHEYDTDYKQVFHYDLENINTQNTSAKSHKKKSRNEQILPYPDDYISVTNHLRRKDRLPAIFFVFSKKFSKELLNEFLESDVELTNDKEKQQIEQIVNEYEDKYGYIGKDVNKDALLMGYAVHNAGILPVQKEMIEELFNKKLLKVVFATETLAAGINMPARTVVISSPEKPTSSPTSENGRRNLTANEYHQMAGRAGRRGIDTIGHVINVVVNPTVDETFKNLVVAPADAIYSSFEPNYSLVANYHKYSKDSEKIKNIFANSFRVYAAGESKNNKKINSMYKQYEAKANLMEAEGFLDINHSTGAKTLTPKGYMLHNIVGYPQIPLINLISSHALQKMTPEELVYLAGAIVGGQYANANNINDELGDALAVPSTSIKNNLFGVKRLLDENPANKDFSNLENVVAKYNRNNNTYRNNLINFNVEDAKNHDLNVRVGSLIYTFAYLNSQRPDKSIENWQAVTSLLTPDAAIKDEGGYYNAVNQTTDLLSQMIDLCNDTKNIYELKNDRMYYKILADKLKLAISLLKQDPIQNFKYEKLLRIT